MLSIRNKFVGVKMTTYKEYSELKDMYDYAISILNCNNNNITENIFKNKIIISGDTNG